MVLIITFSNRLCDFLKQTYVHATRLGGRPRVRARLILLVGDGFAFLFFQKMIFVLEIVFFAARKGCAARAAAPGAASGALPARFRAFGCARAQHRTKLA